MNPVIGLDVSKGESQVQTFLDKGKPYRKSFSIQHNLEGFGNFLDTKPEVAKGVSGQDTLVQTLTYFELFESNPQFVLPCFCSKRLC